VTRPRVLVTQRVVPVPDRGERRDALDQRWVELLLACGLLPVPVPNHPDAAAALLAELEPAGVLFTGGDSLVAHGGAAPERDATERALLEASLARALPVLGVCRGMQLLQDRAGVALRRIAGHVAAAQTITWRGERIAVNSYHDLGATETAPGLTIEGLADDGVVKAVRLEGARAVGIMWHPERLAPFAERDRALLRSCFAGRA
jgi:gamma-glutamyl-gamma-aminobutyrate hydrolase PuuD